jgi:HD-GYP domain-containing protein (c-di-GMP phosphodiesterase class II)
MVSRVLASSTIKGSHTRVNTQTQQANPANIPLAARYSVVKKIISRPGRTVKTSRKYPIPVSGLKIGMYVCELDRPWLETPFLLQGFTIENLDQIDEIAGYCEYVYVEDKEDSWLSAEERAILAPPSRPPKRPIKPLEKSDFGYAGNMVNKGRRLTRSFMDEVRLGNAIDIDQVKSTVSECAKTIINNPDALLWMAKLRKRDEYTAEHSFNVGLLAMTFARHLDRSEQDMHLIGLCGMLHDVGKMRIPNDILNKEGKLSGDEFKVMKAHSKFGRDILMTDKRIDPTAVDVAFGHHEALDGSGYPRQLKATAISEITRIITICDVYDAITSDRIYKKGRSSYEALKVLYENRESKFDARLVEAFIECIGLYPPGSLVDLKNGHAGLVISTNYRNRHLPKENKMPMREKVYDLQRLTDQGNREVQIAAVKPNGTYGVRLEHFINKGLTID